MKKFTALMLIIALTLSMVACNGNTDVTTDDTTATATEAVSATATDTEATTETAKATTEKTTEKKITEQTTEKKTTEQKTTESATTTPRTEQPTTEAKRTEQPTTEARTEQKPTTEAPRTEQPTEARTEATTEAGCQHEWEEYGHVETKYKTVQFMVCSTCGQKFYSVAEIKAHQDASEVWGEDENGDPILIAGCGGWWGSSEQVEDGTVYVADGYRCRKCGATK